MNSTAARFREGFKGFEAGSVGAGSSMNPVAVDDGI